MLSETLKGRVRRGLLPLGASLGAAGFTPNRLTVIGLVLNAAVAAVIASGLITLGGILLLPVAAVDMLDGAVARATGSTTRFGAFIDSTLDRYAEGLVFLGLLLAHAPAGDAVINGGIYLAILGSLMVSYTRARAEGIGVDCEVGLLPRPERIGILAIGLVFGWTMPVVWLLAVLTNLTAGQRMWHVWRATGRGQ